jgi:RHS repeat-associated protein
VQLDGRKQQVNFYRRGFNGMEKDDEVKGVGNSYDFGARLYDVRVGRWMTVDPLATKYTSWSPYVFCIDNPILNIDSDGREVIVTITQRKDQKPLIEIKVSGAIINESTADFTPAQIVKRMNIFQNEVNDVYNKSFDEFEVKVTLDFIEVKSRDEINEEDHVISIQDRWNTSSGGKVNTIGGKVIFLPSSSFSSYKDRPRPHELGHWLGLLHPWDNGYETEFKEGKRNIMSYDGDESGSSIPPNQLTIESHQIKQITQLFFGGKLNQGSNTSKNPNEVITEGIDTYKYNPSEVQLNCGTENCKPEEKKSE